MIPKPNSLLLQIPPLFSKFLHSPNSFILQIPSFSKFLYSLNFPSLSCIKSALTPQIANFKPRAHGHSTMADREPSSKVRIAVRVRPAPPTSTGAECITCLDDGHTLNLNAGSGSSIRPRSFGFDTVLGGDTTQEEFFQGCGVTRLLDAVLEGYTATVFAYGQTGSGKTYTTAGPATATAGPNGALQADAGMMQRAVQYLYTGMAARPGYKYTVSSARNTHPPACGRMLR